MRLRCAPQVRQFLEALGRRPLLCQDPAQLQPRVRDDADNLLSWDLPFFFYAWKTCSERANVGGVSVRSRNGAPSRKGCVVNGQIIQASNE